MRELLDLVCRIEISHQGMTHHGIILQYESSYSILIGCISVDNRLREFTELENNWFKSLREYLIEESRDDNNEAGIEVSEYPDQDCTHLAILKRGSSDYTVMIVLTIGEREGATIVGLLKDVEKGNSGYILHTVCNSAYVSHTTCS